MLSLRISGLFKVAQVIPPTKVAIAFGVVTLILTTFSKDCVRAQITPDDTLGTESSVFTSAGTMVNGSPADLISEGAQREANLFHSFSEFNVDSGQQVYFENPDGVELIVSRVTGDSGSDIFGTVGVLGNADLFFINPNGIVFGPNAALDVNGSFVASTADSLVFDTFEFSASNPEPPPLLTMNAPIGLQFGETAQPILNQSQATLNGETNIFGQPIGLKVQAGNTLALIGGEVVLEGGNLTASGGRIELGSLTAGSFVSLSPSEDGWRLGYEDAQNFQNIQITSRSVGEDEIQSFVDISGQESGNIQLQGKQVILRDGSQILAINLGSELEPGGDVVINASESVELLGNNTFIMSVTLAAGEAGNIMLNTGRLLIQDGAGIFTDSSSGTANGDFVQATGQGGNITVLASESVELVDGIISTNTLTTSGEAGSITIITRQLTISGDGASVSARGASPGEGQVGQAGTVTIETDQLTVEAGAEVTVSSPLGQAGNLEVSADIILLDNGSLTAEAGAGQGAEITLQDLDLLLMRNGSQISAQAFEDADGGNVTINASNGFVVAVPDQDNDIIAKAVEGQGGDIDITVQNIFGLEERPAIPGNGTNDIDASSEFGLDGDVTIETPGVDPNQGIVELPGGLAPPAPSQNCQTSGDSSSRFTNIGRGGLTASPYDPLSGDGVLEDIYPAEQDITLTNQTTSSGDSSAPPEQIVEARGWIVNARGEVVLVAVEPDASAGNLCYLNSGSNAI